MCGLIAIASRSAAAYQLQDFPYNVYKLQRPDAHKRLRRGVRRTIWGSASAVAGSRRLSFSAER
jgi:hypothetical protein